MTFPTRQDCFARYVVASSLVFTAGYLQYRLIHAALKGVPYRAGGAWMLHFMLGTLWSHAFHRGFTFRHVPKLPYIVSLCRTCGAYSILLVLSTLMMTLICDRLGCPPVAGWLLTNLTVSLLNFLVMRRFSIGSVQRYEK